MKHQNCAKVIFTFLVVLGTVLHITLAEYNQKEITPVFPELKVRFPPLPEPQWVNINIEWFLSLNHDETSCFLLKIFDICSVHIPTNTAYIEYYKKNYNAMAVQVNAVLKENKNIFITYTGNLYNDTYFTANFSTETFLEGLKLYKKYNPY